MSSSFILLRAIPSMSSANLADKINFLQTWILSISNIRQTVLVQPFLQLDKLEADCCMSIACPDIQQSASTSH